MCDERARHVCADFTRGTDLDAETRARCAARNIRVIETDIKQLVDVHTGALTGAHINAVPAAADAEAALGAAQATTG
jgi:hypothetical protein